MPRTTPLILLAAPKAATLAAWEELLNDVGYVTMACQTSRMVQQCIDMYHPDLLLAACDLEWYGAGWDLLCDIRQRPAISALPVVLYTSDRHWLRVHERPLQARECQVLINPFSAAELWAAVAAALTPGPLLDRAIGG